MARVRQVAELIVEGGDPVEGGLISLESFQLIRASDAFQGLVAELRSQGQDELAREV